MDRTSGWLRRSVVVLGCTMLVAGLASSTAAWAEPPSGLDEDTTTSLVQAAKTLLERRTSALVNRTSVDQLRPSTSALNTLRAEAQVMAFEQSAINELGGRRQALAEVAEEYTSATTEIEDYAVREEGNTAVLEVTEYTTLNYKQIRGDEPPFTAFESKRTFVFNRTDNGYVLIDQRLSDTQGPVPLNEPNGIPLGEARGALQALHADIGVAAAQPKQAGGNDLAAQEYNYFAAQAYNYNAMAAYAERYWKNYNGDYRRFDGNRDGGDCTNFVSQCMRAGGWPNKNGWYRDYHNWWYNWANQTWSWTGVDHWYSFATSSGRTSILSSPRYMGLADVLQVRFDGQAGAKDHSMIVSYVSGGEKYLTYHTNNTFRRSLSSLMSAYPRARWYPHRT